MTISEWIMVIGFGGMLGMLGQGIRVVVGIKKRIDDAKSKGQAVSPLDSERLVFSLFTGFVAGALAAISMREQLSGSEVPEQMILTLLAIGYAGADFIEGFMQKHLPKEAAADSTSKTATLKTNSTGETSTTNNASDKSALSPEIPEAEDCCSEKAPVDRAGETARTLG